MIIKHIYSYPVFYSWLGAYGATLNPDETREVPDSFIVKEELIDAVNNGFLEIISYSDSPYSFVTQNELDQIISDNRGIFDSFIAIENIPDRSLVYLHHTNHIGLADNSYLGRMPVLGIAQETIEQDYSGKVLIRGIITVAQNLVPDYPVFASNNGNITQIVPQTNILQKVGWALTVNKIDFNISDMIKRA